MTSLDFGALNQQAKDQLAVSLAALILHDDKSDVTTDSLNRILKAANVNVAPYWPMLFAKAAEGKNIGDFLSVSSGSSGPAPTQAAPAKAAEVKQESKPAPKEEVEEVDMDMGDLFG
jgi:large subunit ribosomal protein LP1